MDQETMFQGTACTLEQVLQSRTDRQDRQQALLKKGCSCLLSFGLNVPGAVKQSPALRQVFDEGLSQLRQLLSGALGEESVRHSVTGSEALMEVRLPAGAVKQKTVMLEELHPLGRLFDMDVLDGSGRSLSRRDFGLPARRCLLCGGDAKACGRSRAHDGAALRHLLASGRDVQADVLLAPHHGSDSSFLPEFLTAVRPRLVVASCGAFNRFGHPGKQLRQWLEEQHIPLLQTGRHGHVRVTWPLSGDRDVPLLDWDTARPVRP